MIAVSKWEIPDPLGVLSRGCLLWLWLGAIAGWEQVASTWSWLEEAVAHSQCQVEGLAAGM